MRVTASIRSFPSAVAEPVRAGRRLLVFPHAAGCASFFRGWQSSLGSANAHVVQYPGREERGGERAVEDLVVLASSVAREILAAGLRYDVFFGHSFGAYVAFETAHALEQAGRTPPALVVSSAAAPRTRTPVPYEPAAAVLDHLNRYEQLSPEILGEPDLLDTILGYAAVDLAAVADYRDHRGKKIRAAIVGIAGREDLPAIRDGLAAWAEHTEGEFRPVFVPGGHFYLRDEPPLPLLRSLLDRESETV
ncbi:thioesterase domain-containing protein [Streptomyces sp. NPDC047061]|uniref:thioesterase II family protein n=1 Tax=Streptomyces sp. NPDC047061 TaxID=3154605 RepID=UPI00340074E2